MNRLLAGILAAALTAIPASAQQARPLVLTGEVMTADGWAEAVAVRDGVVVALGTVDEALRAAGPDAERIAVKGAVLPGLTDSHVHPLYAGIEQLQCRLTPGAKPDAIAAAVAGCVARAKPGEWVEGGNWVAAVFAPGQQARAFLDKVAPNTPVLLNDEAHHSLWVNSRALTLAGVTRDTPDPPGGVIERDAKGEPTGLLRESATLLVHRVTPPDSLERRRAALVLAGNQMLAQGITAFTVASMREADMQPLSELSREGLLKQRIRGCIYWTQQPGAERDNAERLIAERARYATQRFAPDCIKLILDGVPTESHTGAMLEPYVDRREGASAAALPETGLLMIPQAELNAAAARFDRMGLSIKFHAAGDGAVRAAIDAVEAAHAANGLGGPLHAVGHSTFVGEADIPRVAAGQMAWEFSPYIWYPTPIASVDILKAVGAKRMERWVPIAEAVRTGALVTAGSDWPVVPSVNPWLGIETMVTRRVPGGAGEPLGGAEAVSLAEAMKIFTVSGARLMGLSDRVGTIAVGMRGDLVVTDRNPFRVPIGEVHATKVLMTFIDGEKVYDAASPPPLQ